MALSGQSEYLRFLIAAECDPDLRARMRRCSRDVRSLDDLVSFAVRNGFRFSERDIPLDAARRPDAA